MPIFFMMFLMTLLSGIAQGAPVPKRMGFQALRMVGGVIMMGIMMAT
jgi:hypothetical protein|eukprot:COSAG01_NODE_8584_length_2728_cov_123.928870_1_plen_47_part_00